LLNFLGLLLALDYHPPNTPSSPSPANDAIDVPITTNLSWTGGDSDGDTVTYDVYLDTDITVTTLICDDVAIESCDPPGDLAYGTHYYWLVNAFDLHGALTAGSTIWEFTTESEPNNPPYPPLYPSPVDGTTGVPITYNSLSWWAYDDPDGDVVTYDVYLDLDPDPTTIVCLNLTSAACDLSDDYVHSNLSATDRHRSSLAFIRYFRISANPAAHRSKQNIKLKKFYPCGLCFGF
jgi:hypothetical protein